MATAASFGSNPRPKLGHFAPKIREKWDESGRPNGLKGGQMAIKPDGDPEMVRNLDRNPPSHTHIHTQSRTTAATGE